MFLTQIKLQKQVGAYIASFEHTASQESISFYLSTRPSLTPWGFSCLSPVDAKWVLRIQTAYHIRKISYTSIYALVLVKKKLPRKT
jgi:hypothetical protein